LIRHRRRIDTYFTDGADCRVSDASMDYRHFRINDFVDQRMSIDGESMLREDKQGRNFAASPGQA
jgi:hypothetical protein